MKRQTVFICAIAFVVVITPSLYAEIIGGSSDTSPPPFWEDSFWWVSPTFERAFPFTTPSDGPFTVEELEVAVHHPTHIADATAYFTINNDINGEPGDMLASVELSGITTSQQVLSTYFTEEPTLNSDTAYWLVAVASLGYVHWNLGDMAFGTAAYRENQGEWIVLSDTNVSAFTIHGSPIPEPSTLLLLGLGAVVLRKRRAT